MQNYEVRLYRADGTLSIVMKTAANGVPEAQAAATAMLKGDIVRAEVWSDEQRVKTLEAA